jgi:hypothetical protein
MRRCLRAVDRDRGLVHTYQKRADLRSILLHGSGVDGRRGERLVERTIRILRGSNVSVLNMESTTVYHWTTSFRAGQVGAELAPTRNLPSGTIASMGTAVN